MDFFDFGNTFLEFVLGVVLPKVGWFIEMTIGIYYSKSLTNDMPLSRFVIEA